MGKTEELSKVTNQDRKWCSETLHIGLGDEFSEILWVYQIVKKKKIQVLIAITKNRLFIIQKKAFGKKAIKETLHLLDLKELYCHDDQEFKLIFHPNTTYRFSTPMTPSLTKNLMSRVTEVTSGFPPQMLPNINMDNTRYDELMSDMPIIDPGEGFLIVYIAIRDYYNYTNKIELQSEMSMNETDLQVRKLIKQSIERNEPTIDLDQVEFQSEKEYKLILKHLFTALRFNTWFENLKFTKTNEYVSNFLMLFAGSFWYYHPWVCLNFSNLGLTRGFSYLGEQMINVSKRIKEIGLTDDEFYETNEKRKNKKGNKENNDNNNPNKEYNSLNNNPNNNIHKQLLETLNLQYAEQKNKKKKNKKKKKLSKKAIEKQKKIQKEIERRIEEELSEKGPIEIILEDLNFSKNNIDSEDLRGFCKIFKYLGTNCLNSIDFSECKLKGKGITILFESLIKNIESTCTLNDINLAENKFNLSATKAFIKWFEKLKCTPKEDLIDINRDLNLRNSNISILHIIPVLSFKHSRITTLDISGCGIDEASATGLSNVIKNTDCLHDLNLSATNFPNDKFGLLLSSMKANINDLQFFFRFNDNYLGVEGAEEFKKIVIKDQKCFLIGFEINQNWLKSQGIKYICEALEKQKIKSLSISENVERANDGEIAGFALATLLKRNKHLETIICRGEDNKYIGAEIRHLLIELIYNSTLKSLDITGNKMGNSGCNCLANAIRNNISLTSLKFDENDFTLHGFVDLAENYHWNDSLFDLQFPQLDYLNTKKIISQLIFEKKMELENLLEKNVKSLKSNIDKNHEKKNKNFKIIDQNGINKLKKEKMEKNLMNTKKKIEK
ncbi:hypothetical protein M0813_21544 [Anaeramoeba flamelloides]|uniref:Uncharacterized protein n=1 Tax=Anaeramoeba flamelloides TaxID=1746091 RepID=A0ABQ8YI55_9EUKA|nr:hypothetical protein M0813_21544 [Anaeramoeba flamelloides]